MVPIKDQKDKQRLSKLSQLRETLRGGAEKGFESVTDAACLEVAHTTEYETDEQIT